MIQRLFTLIFSWIAMVGFSQNIQVTEGNEKINNGNHNVLIVVIPHTSSFFVEKAWKYQMKKMEGKFSARRNEMFVDDAKLKQMGENTLDVYARVEQEGGVNARLVVGFDLGGAYLSSAQHPAQAKAIKALLYDFAVKTAKDNIAEALKTEQRVLEKLEKEAGNLIKEKERLHKAIEDYKRRIEEAEKAIEENKKNQAKKQEEIGEQMKTLEIVEDKMKNIR